MRRFLKIATALALAAAASANAASIYSENFDDGIGQGFSYSGLWHVTQNFPSSPNSSLGFVQNEGAGGSPNGNFNGLWDSTAFGATIALPNTTGLSLSFDAANFQEGGQFWDEVTVGVFKSGNFTPLASSGSGTAPVLITNNVGYNPYLVSLQSFAGQSIQLYFRYRTIDSVGNGYPGARIDNLNIAADVPEPGMIGLLGLGIAGIAAARRRKRA